MARAAEELGEKAERAEDHFHVKRAEELLSELLKKPVRLVASGNGAILSAIAGIKKLMIPDQGGWRGFKTLPKLLGIEVVELKTDLGIIRPEELERALKKEKPDGFIFSSLAGYLAEQPCREIAEVCTEYGVKSIEDISGAFSADFAGKASTLVCSAGAPKILNLVAGGFVAGEFNQTFVRSCRASPVFAAGLLEEIPLAEEVLRSLFRGAEIVKEYVEALFPGSKGVGVGILVENPKKAYNLAGKLGLTTDLGKSLITTCPRYERFLEKGVVLELRKIDVLGYGDEVFHELGERFAMLQRC